MIQTRLVGLDKLKEEIHGKITISQVVEELTGETIQQAGSQGKMLCPFHAEDTPSFYVNDTKGVYKCFGCDASGDMIAFVEDSLNVSFPEAMEKLAELAKIDISQHQRPLTEEEKRRERVRGQVEAWMDSLPLDTSRVSPEGAGSLGIHIANKPLAVDRVASIKNYHVEGTIFPLRSPSGRLVGWKARHPNKKMFATPKDFILHEPTLFGIHEARQHVKDELVLVEGEWDCAVCHDFGFKNTAAIGGTKFTDEQMKVLQDIKIRQVVFAFDGDEAGQMAAEAVARRFWHNKEINVHIADLPFGADPEDVLKDDLGHVNYGMAIASSKSALEWLLHHEWVQRKDTLTDKLEFVEWVRTEFGNKLRPDQEVMVMQQLAEWMDLPDAQLLDITREQKPDDLVSAESERVILGRASRDREYFRALRKRFEPADFHVLRHRRLWQVMVDMLADGMEFDVITVREHAVNSGIDREYMELLADQQDGNISWHEDRILDLAVRRAARNSADRFRERIADVSVDSKLIIGDLTEGVTHKALSTNPLRSIKEQVDQAMETLHERMRNPTSIHGLDLGSQFPLLTDKIQGLQPRRFVLVMAISGIGKTTLTLQWMTNLSVHQSVPVDFISLEMDEAEILFKMAAHLTGIDGMKITGGALEPDEAKRVEQAMARIAKSPFRIYAPDSITTSEFQLYARESKLERRTEVFVVDYAQLVSPDPGMEKLSAYEQLGHFGRTAKMKVARGMDTTVICCAQLARAAKDKERPSKEDIGDSYQLVRDSDVIVILGGHGDDEPETLDLWLDKNRQGPAGILIPLAMDRNLQTIREANAPKNPDYRLMS